MGRDLAPGHIACVGGIVLGDDGRLLMIQRGTEPDLGRWSLPGGRVEAGETDEEAAVREVREETGLDVEVLGEAIGAVELPLTSGAIADVVDFLCRPVADSDLDAVQAGDDAADARWCTPAEVRGLDCSPGLVDLLVDWGVLPSKHKLDQRGSLAID